VVVSEPIAEYFEDKMLWLGLTYSGHALACACGIAVINVYKEDKLLENCQRMGKVLGDGLERLKDNHRSVGDVRHIGLFSVIELVKDRKTKEPMAPWNASSGEMETMGKVKARLLEKGLSTLVRWNWVFACPPLCINESELKEGLAIVDDALEIADTMAP
jgi:taurine--2-oxoglutarate transaminase